jgi:prophage antirepressor-like protein
MTTALTFNDVTLSPVQHQGSLWIRAAELARALGYSDDRKVSIIYARHKDEFSNDMSVVLNLSTTATPAMTRLFSPRGCHMIAMLARTKVAKAFRRWVLDVLDKFAETERQPEALAADAPLTPEQQCTLQNIVKAKVEALPEAQRKGRGLYPQIWSRFNNHFRIARYCQLPQCRLAEAVAYLVRLDIEPKPKALPQPEALSMPKPDTNREKFVRFLEKVEALRAQTDRTLRDLAVEGAALLDDDRFGTTRWNTSSIIHDWLLNVVPRPLEIRPDFEMARGLFAFLHDVENLLPLRWR